MEFFTDRFPPNPVHKEGYILQFQDEFEGPDIDTQKWVPYYLPHWSSREQAKPNYAFEDSQLLLQITRDQQPWCPEFDGQVKCSSIQTGEFCGPAGSPVGQHRFNPALRVREAQANRRTYTPQFGFFECRARGVNSHRNHVALWMIGYEDSPERSGEIAIFEIMGETVRGGHPRVRGGHSRVGHGVRRWYDPSLKDAFFEPYLPLDATQFHIYGLGWYPTHLDFFIDNVKIRTIDQSPAYPMQFMLSIYELPPSEEEGEEESQPGRYPKQFAVDYFRGYQLIK